MPGKRGFGAQVGRCTTQNGSYTVFANVTKISPFAVKADNVDVSSHDSPVSDADPYNGWRETLAGLLAAGATKLDLNYDDGNVTHQALLSEVGLQQWFRITFPGANPSTVTIAGHIADVAPEVPHDNKMTCSATFNLSGKPVFGQYIAAPVATAATSKQATSFSANWGSVSGATKYYLDVATDPLFVNKVTGFDNLDCSTNVTQSVTGLTTATIYFYRVRAYKATGTSFNSNIIYLQTS